jgi:hypothetical protein
MPSRAAPQTVPACELSSSLEIGAMKRDVEGVVAKRMDSL